MSATFIAGATLALSAISSLGNWINGNKSNDQTLLSNYYSYMQNLESMKSNLGQTQTAYNQTVEDIASNQYYLDAWKNEYDQSMASATDEAYSQYQQMASNLASGLVNTSESGRVGGSAGLINASTQKELSGLTGTSDGSFGLSGSSRLGSYLNSTALDMLADRQTALSAVDTGYKSLSSYQSAMEDLSASISEMEGTTTSLKKKLQKKGLLGTEEEA